MAGLVMACYPFKLDYEEFPWLPPEGSSGLKIKFFDDEEALKYYVKYYLGLSNDVIKSAMFGADVSGTDNGQEEASNVDVTSIFTKLNMSDNQNKE